MGLQLCLWLCLLILRIQQAALLSNNFNSLHLFSSEYVKDGNLWILEHWS